MISKVKYPNIAVILELGDVNVQRLSGKIIMALNRNGLYKEAEDFLKQVDTAKDYNEMLKLCTEKVLLV